MRTTYLVCYDIADPKRLRKVFKICRNFGDHLQFSVFECDLNPSEKVRLETELKGIIDHTKDQVLFVGLGPSEGRGDRVISALGQPGPPRPARNEWGEGRGEGPAKPKPEQEAAGVRYSATSAFSCSNPVLRSHHEPKMNRRPQRSRRFGSLLPPLSPVQISRKR